MVTSENYKVDIESGCWNWPVKNKFRYGPYRKYYEMFIGPIPKGMVVMHTCDNKNCVNPSHLKLGTQFENLYDASSKGQRLKNGTKVFPWKANLLRDKAELTRKLLGQV